MTVSLLPLDETVEKIVQLASSNASYQSLSAKDAAKLYLAGLALLCHLKADHHRIQQIG